MGFHFGLNLFLGSVFWVQKLIALKKVYADIILNISKEAAARVTSSERSAVRYQHELKVEKEEGLRMITESYEAGIFRQTQMTKPQNSLQIKSCLQVLDKIPQETRKKRGKGRNICN